MRLTTGIAFALGAFYVLAGFLYAATSEFVDGFPLLMAAAIGIVALATYLLLAVRRAERALAASEEAGEEAEPHVGPTIWPFGYALSAVGLVLAFLVYPPLYIIGGALFLLSTAGWFADVRGQWLHGAQAPSEPGPPRGPDTTPTADERVA